MNRDELVALISATARDFVLTAAGDAPVTVDEATRLFGSNGLLDSLGLVSVVLDVEQQINDHLNLAISIADDRAMSQQRSPFRTVGSLADYVLTLIAEQPQVGNAR